MQPIKVSHALQIKLQQQEIGRDEAGFAGKDTYKKLAIAQPETVNSGCKLVPKLLAYMVCKVQQRHHGRSLIKSEQPGSQLQQHTAAAVSIAGLELQVARVGCRCTDM